jgi:DNA polymerase/3'-5' exonuclease PolX
MELGKAREIAEYYVHELKPFCEKVEIAGSIRREKPEVKDIEICCVPKTYTEQIGMFDSDPVRIHQFVDYVNDFTRIRGNGKGKYVRAILREQIDLDLFITTPEQWGVIFLIRTGSAEYSKNVVTKIKDNGFWVEDGWLNKKSDKTQETKIPVYEEKDFYEITGLQYIEPKLRL